MTDQSTCKHESFAADVEVCRDDKDGKFAVDVRVTCIQCKLPFSFIGLPFGCDSTRPTSSVDGLELRAPIRPGENTREDFESRGSIATYAVTSSKSGK